MSRIPVLIFKVNKPSNTDYQFRCTLTVCIGFKEDTDTASENVASYIDYWSGKDADYYRHDAMRRIDFIRELQITRSIEKEERIYSRVECGYLNVSITDDKDNTSIDEAQEFVTLLAKFKKVCDSHIEEYAGISWETRIILFAKLCGIKEGFIRVQEYRKNDSDFVQSNGYGKIRDCIPAAQETFERYNSEVRSEYGYWRREEKSKIEQVAREEENKPSAIEHENSTYAMSVPQ